VATIASGDSNYNIDANISGPDANGRYIVLLQKPVSPAALWRDEVVVQLDDQIVWQGTWSWKDQIGPT
jgi:hypothetical protein